MELLHDTAHRDPEPRAPPPLAALALQAALNALNARVEALAEAAARIDDALERP